MQCPECDGKMVPEQHSGIAIDRCMGCEGLWFDAGELEHYLQAMAARDRKPEIGFEAEASAPAPSTLPPRTLECPKCGSALERGKSGDITLSRCGGCQGFSVSADDVLSAVTGGKFSAKKSTLRAAAGVVETGVMVFSDLLIDIFS